MASSQRSTKKRSKSGDGPMEDGENMLLDIDSNSLLPSRVSNQSSNTGSNEKAEKRWKPAVTETEKDERAKEYAKKRKMQTLVNELAKIPPEDRSPMTALEFLQQPRWGLTEQEALYALKYIVSQIAYDRYCQGCKLTPSEPAWVENVGSLYFPSPSLIFSVQSAAVDFFY